MAPAVFKLSEDLLGRADDAEALVVVADAVRNRELDARILFDLLIHRPRDVAGRGFQMKDGVEHVAIQ